MNQKNAYERVTWLGFTAAALLLLGMLGWSAKSSLSDEFDTVGGEVTQLARVDSIPVAMAIAERPTRPRAQRPVFCRRNR
jgi:hypothetical protein